jgi:hypothetical protein
MKSLKGIFIHPFEVARTARLPYLRTYGVRHQSEGSFLEPREDKGQRRYGVQRVLIWRTILATQNISLTSYNYKNTKKLSLNNIKYIIDKIILSFLTFQLAPFP